MWCKPAAQVPWRRAAARRCAGSCTAFVLRRSSARTLTLRVDKASAIHPLPARTFNVTPTAGRCLRQLLTPPLRRRALPWYHSPLPSSLMQARRWMASQSEHGTNGGAGWRLVRTGGIIGLTMGFFGGLVGQGGGVVGIPMMISLISLTQHQAQGTSLVAVTATGIAGALAYWQGHETGEGVDPLAALLLAGSAALFVPLGARATRGLSSPNLTRIMSVCMFAASLSVAWKAYWEYKESKNPHPHPTPIALTLPQLTSERIATIGTIGIVTGFASGFLGVGGGLVMVPLLMLCTSMHQSQVLGTSLLAMVVPSVVGSITHYRLGHVFVPIVPPMIVGSLLGAYLGGKISVSLTQNQQRAIVASTLFILAMRTLR